MRNKKLPNGRGIELESSSGKVWTISPEGNNMEYNSWLETLSNIVSKQNHDLYNRTKDKELRKALGDIRSSMLKKQSIDAVTVLVTNVDDYNVDMVEIIKTESDMENDDDNGNGWNTFDVADDDGEMDEVKSDIPHETTRKRIEKLENNRGVSKLSIDAVGITPKSIRTSIKVPKPETRFTEFTSYRGYIKPVSYTHLTLPTN